VKLIIMRGLPGCGKTTLARAWVEEDTLGRFRINRDDTRDMGHGRRLGTSTQEHKVTVATHAAVYALLADGCDVMCDDTNLTLQAVAGLYNQAVATDSEFEIWDMTSVPVDVCVQRDKLREGADCVGEDVIRDMNARHLDGQPPLRSAPGCTVRSFDPATGSFAASRI
jgi:tRNA uridine 5-carbamoylmethylation protein Kti12